MNDIRSAKLLTPLNAVTATTTSSAIDVKDARKITLEFTRADHSSGSSTFTIFGSISGESGTFTALNNMVKDVTNTNAQDLTRVASVALSSNTTEIVALDINNLGFTHIKITVTKVTDGTQTAKALIEY